MVKRLAAKALHLAESLFLLANGWIQFRTDERDDYWMPPKGYPGRRKDGHCHGHAVNAAKLWASREKRGW